MYDNAYLLLQTIFIPIFFSIIILLLGKKLREKNGFLTFIPLLYITIILLYINVHLSSWNKLIAEYYWIPSLGNFILLADGLSAPIALVIAFLGTIISLYSIYYMKNAERLELYFFLYLLYVSGMIGTVLSINLAAFFIFFEFMLIPSWILVGVWGTGKKEIIAFKYFLYTEIGALSLLMGIGLIYSQIGSLNIFEIARLSSGMDISMILLILILILIGFFIKMAIVPLHSWLPDAHAEAPTPISALLSPAMIGIGGYASIRIIYSAFPQVLHIYEFTISLSILALITMIYGGLMAIAQNDIKRFLAYSSISQMGYMLFGISSLSNTGIVGSLLLYISHGLAKAVLFMITGIIMHEIHTRKISDLSGLASIFPLTTITALVSLLSLAGVPPMIGFWGEIFIFAGSMYSAFSSSIDIIRIIITSIGIVSSVLTAGYGLWMVKRAFYGEPNKLVEKAKEPVFQAILLLVLTLFVVLIGLYPTPIIVNFFKSMQILP
ncbi:MAG: formate hydrogenlyase [Thermoprotei archaeon]|nr:MAG: formate hydrogenlyase [Thermoprotei archaeon]RLE73422.1 MAG: formate hydrogenlyase [Thermoprotei archaeon]